MGQKCTDLESRCISNIRLEDCDVLSRQTIELRCCSFVTNDGKDGTPAVGTELCYEFKLKTRRQLFVN
jgi:hypothetical protein